MGEKITDEEIKAEQDAKMKLRRSTYNAVVTWKYMREIPKPKIRPWTPEEGVGKVVRDKSGDGVVLVVGFSNGAFDIIPHGRYTADKLMEYWECLDESPCGVEVNQ